MSLYATIVTILVAAALANPVAEQQAKAPRAEKCNSNVYNCLLTYYDLQFSSIQSYCTSFLSISTSTKTLTSTDTSTSYTKTVTKRDAPTTVVDGSAVTAIATKTAVVEVPISTTTVLTIFTGSTTVTSTVATLTDVATAVSTSFVCDLPSPSPDVTAGPAMKAKRQQARPFTCADRNGSNGISSGCRCAEPAIRTPTTTITTTSTKTVSKVSTVETVTSTRTPVITATIVTIQATEVVLSVTASEILTYTSSITATSSTTITTTVTRTSEAPRAFALRYTDTSSTTQYGHISTPSDRPGSSGTLITFKPDQALPDIFSLNAQKQLITSSNGLVLEKNSRDPFPYLFLDNGTTAANSPVFSVCGGRLRAEYPGTQGNGFAVCDEFLALGSEAVFTEPSCRKISLGFGEVPVAQNQRE